MILSISSVKSKVKNSGQFFCDFLSNTYNIYTLPFFFSGVMIMLQYWLDFVHTADHLEISSATPNLKCLPEVVEQLHQSGQGCEVSR